MMGGGVGEECFMKYSRENPDQGVPVHIEELPSQAELCRNGGIEHGMK